MDGFHINQHHKFNNKTSLHLHEINLYYLEEEDNSNSLKEVQPNVRITNMLKKTVLDKLTSKTVHDNLSK